MTSVLANTKLQTVAQQRDLSIIYPPIRRKPGVATFIQTQSSRIFKSDSIMFDEYLSEVMERRQQACVVAGSSPAL